MNSQHMIMKESLRKSQETKDLEKMPMGMPLTVLPSIEETHGETGESKANNGYEHQ